MRRFCSNRALRARNSSKGVVLLVCAIITHQLALDLRAQQSLESNLLDEGVSAWGTLRDELSSVTGRATRVDRILKSDEEVWRKELAIEFDVNGDCKAVRLTNMSTGKHAVLGVNDDYMFHLDRHFPDGEYSLSEFQDPDAARWTSLSDGEPQYYAYQLREKLDLFLNSPYSVLGVPLPEIVQGPGFELLGIEEFEEEGARYVRLRYNFDSGLEDVASLSNANVVVLRDRQWVVSRFEADAARSHYDVTIEYAGIGEQVLPGAWHCVVTDPNDPDTVREIEYNFDEIRQESVSDDAFRLPAFGLPEPELGRGRYPFNSWWFWFFLVNAVAAGAVLVLWRRRRGASV